jgi:hypothetical protein
MPEKSVEIASTGFSPYQPGGCGFACRELKLMIA